MTESLWALQRGIGPPHRSELGWFLVWRKCRLVDILLSLGHGHRIIAEHVHLVGAQEPSLCQTLGGEPCFRMLHFRPRYGGDLADELAGRFALPSVDDGHQRFASVLSLYFTRRSGL